ncbi:MAG: hypothetical protein H6675_05220 [Dehalococcoidia bacterium]|nr:hypothetical protein [Dehalococcoidia bacterium]
MADIDEQRSRFRPAGLTFTEQDFDRWTKEQRQEALVDPARVAADDIPPLTSANSATASACPAWQDTRLGARCRGARAGHRVLGRPRLAWRSARERRLLAAATLALVVTVPV